MSSTTPAQVRLQQAAFKQIERDISRLAVTHGVSAIEAQVRLFSRLRKALGKKPRSVELAEEIDWALECCYRNHPAYSGAINKFVASIA